MAGIPKFDAQAPRLGNIDVTTRTGVPEMLASIATDTNQLTARLGAWADQAAKREGEQAGAAAAMQVQMPGVDFAFDKSSAATTPVIPGGKLSAEADSAIAQAASQYGVSAAYLQRVAAIESSGRANAVSSTGAKGPFQFVSGTARRYGLVNPFDWTQSARAAARLTADNAAYLKKQLGRDPTLGELYLAHQQGAAGAARLLSDPKQLAANAVGARAVKVNGGTAAMQAGEFAGQWTRRFADLEGAAPAAAARSTPVPAEYASKGITQDQWDAMNAPDPGTTASTSPGGAPASAGAVKVTLTGGVGPTPQSQAGTIFGDAYNNAAMNITVNRADTAMRGQMEALALQYEGDPAGLSSSLDALRAGYVKDMPPAAAALIDDSFGRQKFALVREAITKFNSNLESANQAAFEENISARTSSVYRLAAAGGNDAETDAAIAGELGALTQSIDSSPMTPLQKSRFKADAVGGVITARVLGGFAAQKDPAARAAFAQKFQADWQSGEGLVGQMDVKTYDSVNGELVRRLQADEVAANKRATALDKSIEGQISTLKKGWPVPDANRAVLRNEVAKTGDRQLAANLDFLDSLATWQKAHIAARPEVVDAQIQAMQAKIQKEGASDAALTTLDVMEGLRDEMRKGLAADPLTWANRAGVAQVEPLDFSDSEHLAASLTERVNDATAIAQHYGIEPKYFTAAETDGLKKMMKQTPLAMPSIVSSLTAGFGSATPQALGELSKDAPVLAHVAALVNTTGDQRPAVEIAEVLDRRNQPGYKSPLPPAAKLQSAAAKEIGAALLTLPNTMTSTVETASTLFEGRAAARGIDMEQFDTEGSPARELYLDTLDEVLGATKRNGVKYGGLTAVNGLATVAPPDIEAQSLQRMVENISPDDLLFQPAIGSANGVPIAASDLRRGQLVMTSIGKYRIALGDIAGGDPRYVPSASGGYFELDLGMLQRTQKPRLGDQVLPTNPGNFR